jgi:hypothetical protein
MDSDVQMVRREGPCGVQASHKINARRTQKSISGWRMKKLPTFLFLYLLLVPVPILKLAYIQDKKYLL